MAGQTLNGQRLSDISKLTVRLKDGAGNSIEMQLITEVSETDSTPHEAVYDRKVIKGLAKVNPEAAEITINGHYTGLKTRSDGTGHLINPIEFMRGQHAGAQSVDNITGDFCFDMEIEETDQSASPINERLTYSCCALTSVGRSREPGTNKIDVTIMSADETPTITHF